MLGQAPQPEEFREAAFGMCRERVARAIDSKWPVAITDPGVKSTEPMFDDPVWNYIAGGKVPFGHVPKIPGCCDDICGTTLGPHGELLEEVVLERVEASLKRVKQPHTLVEVRISNGIEERRAGMWLIKVWVPTAGAYPFRAVFTRCAIRAEADFIQAAEEAYACEEDIAKGF